MIVLVWTLVVGLARVSKVCGHLFGRLGMQLQSQKLRVKSVTKFDAKDCCQAKSWSIPIINWDWSWYVKCYILQRRLCNLNIVMCFLPLLDGVSLSLTPTAFSLVWRASFSPCRLSIFLCASWSFFSKSLFSSCVCMKVRFNINISHVWCKCSSLNTCESGLFETHT